MWLSAIAVLFFFIFIWLDSEGASNLQALTLNINILLVVVAWTLCIIHCSMVVEFSQMEKCLCYQIKRNEVFTIFQHHFLLPNWHKIRSFRFALCQTLIPFVCGPYNLFLCYALWLSYQQLNRCSTISTILSLNKIQPK